MRIQLMSGLVGLAILGFACAEIHAQFNKQQDSLAPPGTIAGKVLDPEGQPVRHATVYVERTDQVLGKLASAYTNRSGAFLIKALSPGTYAVHATKEEDGYPDTDSGFYSDGPLDVRRVTVSAQQMTPELVIRLGPKAARLIGRIVDGSTNEPVAKAQVTLIRIDDPDKTYSTGPNLEGRFNMLVPSVPFTIKVSAPGYEDWVFRNERSRKQPDALHLSSATTREINIALHRSK